MNICALDIIERTDDFETVASALELRGWEWDLLHAIDGTMTIAALAHGAGVDLDETMSFVHDAMQRGLVCVPTMTLQAYRAARSMQIAIPSAKQSLSLTTVQSAEPPAALSFTSEAIDWEALDASAPEAAATELPAGVHYDARFGVEHPDGPFASPEPLADGATGADGATDEDATSYEATPARQALITTRSGSYASHDDREPVAEEAGESHVPIRFDDLFATAAPLARQPIETATNGSTNGYVSADAAETIETVAEAPSETYDEPSPSRISFSFSPDDLVQPPSAVVREPEPEHVDEAPPSADVSVVTAEPQAHYEEAPARSGNGTQSTFHEREAIENDGTREYESKAKSWKESLSWREQQELHEASEAGTDKPGVVSSLLRALGVR